MRTTLSLDDDVAAWLDRVRAERDASLKQVVNEALRHGLARMEEPRSSQVREPYTRPMNLGACLLDNLDDIGAVMEIAEGDAWK